MATTRRTLRICANGHQYYKSSDCPVCPVCEKENKHNAALFSKLSAPAKRALERYGIKSVQQLAHCTEKEILTLHGIGKSSVPKLVDALKAAGLTFKNQ